MNEIYNENDSMNTYEGNVNEEQAAGSAVHTEQTADSAMRAEQAADNAVYEVLTAGSTADEEHAAYSPVHAQMNTVMDAEIVEITSEKPANNFDPYTGRPLNAVTPDSQISYTYGSGAQDAYGYGADTQNAASGTSAVQSSYSYGADTQSAASGTSAAQSSYSYGADTQSAAGSTFAAQSSYNYGSDTQNNTANTSAAQSSYNYGSDTQNNTANTSAAQSSYNYGSDTQNNTANTSAAQSSYVYGADTQNAANSASAAQDAYSYSSMPQSTYTYGTTYRSAQNAPAGKEKKARKGMPLWLKIGLASVSFGLLAAGTFICTNTLYNRFINSQKPAVTEDAAGNKQKDNGIPEQIGKTETKQPAASEVKTTKPGKATTDASIPSTDVLVNGDTCFYDLSSIVENVMPSIVQITCTFNTQSFFGTYQSTGAGSGIIIKQSDDELLIATNNHVVEDALSITVTFDDDKEVTGYTKGTDAMADLAVVAVKLSDIDKDTLNNIKVATLGDSDGVKVGQMAIAIGNALGYGTSTTVGYISAIDREVKVDGKTMTLLQTDAAINPGNSGGALLNIYGEVIGINSVKYASDEVEGMGFAIPISRAMSILDNLANREVLKDSEKGYLGIYMRNVTSDIANAYNWPMGVYVSEIVDGSPADNSELLVGDIITAINGIGVQTSTDLRNEITSYRAGTTVTLTVSRLSKGRFSEEQIEVTLTTNPDYSD